MPTDAKTIVEKALTDTLYRHIYFGHQIHKQLALLQDVLDTDNKLALDYVRSWMLMIDHNEIYRKSVVQNNLIDLQYLIVSYTPTPEDFTEEVISA